MRETGAILVPTRTIIEDILADLTTVPDVRGGQADGDRRYARGRRGAGHRARRHHRDGHRHRADRPGPAGRLGPATAAELPHLVALGMTPLQAIEAATATAPLTLGPQAPRSGRLEDGYDADVITLDADPLADIGVMPTPAT